MSLNKIAVCDAQFQQMQQQLQQIITIMQQLLQNKQSVVTYRLFPYFPITFWDL